MQQVLLQYGILGVIVIGLSSYIITIETRHRKERKEWMEANNRLSDRSNSMADETNRVLRENTNILASLKALLENRIRR